MSDLFSLSVAQQEYEHAARERVAAIVREREAGASWVAIGKAMGLTEAAVRRLAARHTGSVLPEKRRV